MLPPRANGKQQPNATQTKQDGKKSCSRVCDEPLTLISHPLVALESPLSVVSDNSMLGQSARPASAVRCSSFRCLMEILLTIFFEDFGFVLMQVFFTLSPHFTVFLSALGTIWT